MLSKVMVMIGISIVMFCGCQNEAQTQLVPDQSEHSTQNSIPDKTIEPDSKLKQMNNLDENQFSGTKLKLVRLINQATKFINQQDQTGFFKLFTQDTPVNQMPKHEIKNLKLRYDFSDTKKTVVSVEVDETYSNNKIRTVTYVFQKVNDQWKISDMD